MTSHSYETPSIAEVYASVKRLEYGSQQSIRLYGEEFEVISDPFPEAGGIAVSVKTKKRRWSPRNTAARDSASERGRVIAERSLRIRLLIHHRVLIIAVAIGNARQMSGTSATQHIADC